MRISDDVTLGPLEDCRRMSSPYPSQCPSRSLSSRDESYHRLGIASEVRDSGPQDAPGAKDSASRLEKLTLIII